MSPFSYWLYKARILFLCRLNQRKEWYRDTDTDDAPWKGRIYMRKYMESCCCLIDTFIRHDRRNEELKKEKGKNVIVAVSSTAASNQH